MNLTPYLDGLRRDLAAAAAAGGPETGRAAELLGGSLEASGRLALLEALADAAAEITARLSSASVEVRLRGRDAEFVVTEAPPDIASPPPATATPVDGGELARLTLRMPESLKERVEQSAAAEGVSVNAWLVLVVAAAASAAAGAAHAAAAAGEAATGARATGRDRSGRRITGYAQA
jgi:hypothetical protein